ncbi:unnamed protein product [Caenorhabditis sp. 36 PRJEB53466]|nr:unnamed protein product [Caenorhabditis sp. 36 PRJEB53466]
MEMNRKILATMKIPKGVVQSTVSRTTGNPQPRPRPQPAEQEMIEGDTARALSWMINDMERLVDDQEKTKVVDRLPVEKVETPEAAGFRLGEAEPETEGPSPTTVSPFPFPVPEDGFALIRSKRNVKQNKYKKVLWSSWSEWTECECGKQSRKRKCLKYIESKYPSDSQVFVPIDQTTNSITFEEPAEFPESIPEPAPIEESLQRVKRSLKCPPPQIEFRSCYSSLC